jgi:hypothetical protein
MMACFLVALYLQLDDPVGERQKPRRGWRRGIIGGSIAVVAIAERRT